MSLGWRRGLLDVYCFALLNNALAEAAAQTRIEASANSPAHRRHRSA
jgi:hypothetical protein